MSIFTRFLSGALVFGLSTPAFAFGTDLTTPVVTTPAPLGVMVAQTSRTVLADRDIRRINHYSGQALDALLTLGTDDSAVSLLRQRVQRLVGAGERSGMDLLNTADYFQAYLAENNNAPLPGALLDADGRFNARGLFTATMMYLETQQDQAVDVAAVDEADLAAIGSVAQRLAPQAPVVQETLQLSVTVQPAEVVETPVIPVNAPANVRAILERVELKGEDWVITVKQGDSLGQFANALYGDTLFFQRIFEANLGVLSTPNSITVGQELVLPRS